MVSKTLTNPWYFLALGFGSGLFRWAPGTAGSLIAIPIYLLFAPFGNGWHLIIVLTALIAGVWLCDYVAKDMHIKDPASIVWDEFVGIWITFLWLPEGWYWLLIGFGLFRFFDIVKPWPVSWLDANLTGGFGILMDDVAAGLYSLGIIQVSTLLLSRL